MDPVALGGELLVHDDAAGGEAGEYDGDGIVREPEDGDPQVVVAIRADAVVERGMGGAQSAAIVVG